MYTVNFTKLFVKGSVAGLTHESSLNFLTREGMQDYCKFLAEHTVKPVDAIGGSDYVILSWKVLETKEIINVKQVA